MNKMQQAFAKVNVTRHNMSRLFKKGEPVGPMCNDTPLVISTDMKSNGKGRIVSGRKHVQRVSHITGIGSSRRAVTEGGDVWSFTNRGNGFLEAVE